MAENIFSYAPNGTAIKEVTSAITWQILGLSGNGYPTVAALIAASDAVYPSQYNLRNEHFPWSVEPGIFFQTFTINSDGGNGTQGSPFYVAINYGLQPPTDQNAGILIGSGGTYQMAGKVYNIWYRKTTATDKLTFKPAF